MNTHVQVWEKIGLVHCPDGSSPEQYSHAAVPFLQNIKNGMTTIYFTTRDVNNRSSLASIEFNLINLQTSNPSTIPLLKGGTRGSFDEDGVMGCGFFQTETETFLTYIGWNIGKSVPFRNAIGLAKYSTNHFEKVFEGPILDRSPFDPCFVASNCILKIGKKYIMYYLSCNKWEIIDNCLTHFYNIKIAESDDGLLWKPTNKVAIDFKDEYEYAISVPRVIVEDNLYKMWYSYRASADTQTYRIGYAESENGYQWIRKDNLVRMNVSDDGWDSEMICYPFIFDFNNDRYMLYNGNGYGKTGFGIAKLKNETNRI